MKKIFISFGVLALGLGAFTGLKGNRPVKVGADDATELQALLRSYNDGGYTKKTQMYLTDGAVAELASYFHAGQNTLKRATYYNASETALLMGNYDGTFGGAGGINGGFRNISAVACERFHYTDETPNVDNLFLADHTETDYVAVNQTVGSYYQTLYSLSEAVVSGQWVKSDGAYIHNISNLHVTDGEYDDPVLKKFQYFAAPMMLQNAYFSWHTIRVVEGASFLSIRLYTTAEDGAGKSTLVGASEALVSEARVYKGLHFSPEVTWTLKGSFDSWGAGQQLTYSGDLYNPEQYAITVNLFSNDQIKFNSGSTYLGFDSLENDTWFYRWNNGEADNNIIVKLSGQYTFYLKPRAGTIYAAVPANGSIDIPLEISSEWKSDSAVIYAYTWGDGLDDHWFRANAAATSVTITGLYTGMKLVRINPAHADNPGWGDGVKWNETGNLTIEHLKTLKLEGWQTNVYWY